MFVFIENDNLKIQTEPEISNVTSYESVSLEQGQTFVDFELQSNLIGIFTVDCYITEASSTKELLARLEVVVGRVKVEENILVNLMFSVGMGAALLIMGMEIEVEKVLEVVK